MKSLTLVFVITGVFLSACDRAEKTQTVIFDVESISCKGAGRFCGDEIKNNRSNCEAISASLQSKLAEGWRVVSSSPKEKVVSSDSYNTTSCVGTEYVIEK